MTRLPRTFIAASLAALVLSACREGRPAIGAPLPGGAHAMAVIHDAGGAVIGRATASDVGGGLRVTIDASMLPPGPHGAHLHAAGRCDAPAFTTAGAHWNPAGRQHGSMNPAGQHEGDLPNLMVGADGRGTLGIMIPGATLAGLLDADGAAVILHAGPDDLMTDPAGNSGGRIACGVFQRS